MDSKLDIAINDNGVEVLLADIRKELVTTTIAKMGNTKNLIAAVRTAWVGEDCELFITDFLTKKKIAEQNLNAEFAKISAQFNNVRNEWADFRNTNYNPKG